MSTPSIHNEADYKKHLPSLTALCQEVHFILQQALTESGIKFHAVESRVKELDSILRKLSDISKSSVKNINDVVGTRVVCLFNSDIKNIKEIIEKEFDVQSIDDKLELSTDTFGYMSIHYICRLKPNLSGRRYDSIKDHFFEIQVRTLCMHAWAAISHHLEYKSEWDIPDHLKKGLNALSGLFYVADSQYEQLYLARELAREEAGKEAINDQGNIAINFDTVDAYLKRKFPNREPYSLDSLSELVGELSESGILSIQEIDRLIHQAQDEFKKDEREQISNSENKDADMYYNAVGVARISLCAVHKKYKKIFDEKMKDK
jgi:putative GTP pyrophosphokinase